MKIHILNNSSYSNIFLYCEGKEYNLLENGFTDVNTINNYASLSFIINDKNTVYPNLTDLLCGIINPYSLACNLKCNYTCNILCSENICNVCVTDIMAQEDNIVFESIFLSSPNAKIESTNYKLTNVSSVIKKHTMLQLLLFSALPITLLLIAFCLKNFSWSLFELIIVDLLILVFPGIKRIKQFNDSCNDTLAKELLSIIEFKKRNDTLEDSQTETKIERFVFKIFDKLFK